MSSSAHELSFDILTERVHECALEGDMLRRDPAFQSKLGSSDTDYPRRVTVLETRQAASIIAPTTLIGSFLCIAVVKGETSISADRAVPS